MVEMMEVSNILKDATSNSLVILDEIGRGTSTYDGLSIAWAVAEYIADKSKIGCKTLFATHYHELTRLESEFLNIKNVHVSALEEKGKVFFEELFDVYTKEYVVVTFLALLDMTKQQEVKVTQENNFSKIWIEAEGR